MHPQEGNDNSMLELKLLNRVQTPFRSTGKIQLLQWKHFTVCFSILIKLLAISIKWELIINQSSLSNIQRVICGVQESEGSIWAKEEQCEEEEEDSRLYW